MEQRQYKTVGKSIRKKDSMQLLLGKAVYTDDVTPKGAPGGEASAQSPCQRHGPQHQHRRGEESPRGGGCVHLGGCAPDPVRHCGPDLSGAVAL